MFQVGKVSAGFSHFFFLLYIQIKYLLHSCGCDGRTQTLRISASIAEPLEPRPRSPLHHDERRAGGTYRHEGVVWSTRSERFNDLEIHSVRTVCMYIYLAHIFAFQLYLIFKVYQRRDVRPAVCNIVVQIDDFFLFPSLILC